MGMVERERKTENKENQEQRRSRRRRIEDGGKEDYRTPLARGLGVLFQGLWSPVTRGHTQAREEGLQGWRRLKEAGREANGAVSVYKDGVKGVNTEEDRERMVEIGMKLEETDKEGN